MSLTYALRSLLEAVLVSASIALVSAALGILASHINIAYRKITKKLKESR